MLMRAGELPLRAFLEPVPELNDPSVREIVINRPGEIGVERAAGWTWREVPEFTLDRLDQIGILAGWALSLDFDTGNPICKTTFPDGQRCTFIRDPAVTRGTMSVTVRNPSCDDDTVFDHDFGRVLRAAERASRRSKVDEELLRLYRDQSWAEFFDLAVKSRKTIGATGSTGSGKTTFIRKLSRSIPPTDRIVTIEDTDEFGDMYRHRNRVAMFFGSANVTAELAVETSLRMRPDRVLMQELRGAEAWAYIRLLAAGHPGGMTTWHAEDGDPFTPLALMAKQSKAGGEIPDDKLSVILRRFIDIVAHCKKDDDGFHVPYSVWFRAAEEDAAE
jgi:type IV secretion system protein VirB11